ncbi:MAG TPA: Os1348 family NHLP clan protein [Ktedonobacteraceae bacterium]|nr:Os1348 family NHLP clan protein [Ktedonobacteraceae bacterium]
MPWQTMNKLLGLAMIDEEFAKSLLQAPRETLSTYGIQLLPDELEILCSCRAQTLDELSQYLIDQFQFPGE